MKNLNSLAGVDLVKMGPDGFTLKATGLEESDLFHAENWLMFSTVFFFVGNTEQKVASGFPSETGRLMARYCIAFDTMKHFQDVRGTESLDDLVHNLSASFHRKKTMLRFLFAGRLSSYGRSVSALGPL